MVTATNPPPELLSPTPLLTCELSPSLIHANSSLSRRIYIPSCRAKVVSRFIWAEFIGSGLLTCLGLSVVFEMLAVGGLEARGHALRSKEYLLGLSQRVGD